MFGVIDLTFFTQFLQSVLGTLDGIDPAVAGLGALVLLVLQRMGGGKFDTIGFVKTLFARFAPSSKGGVIADLPDATVAEVGLIQSVVAKIKASREAVKFGVEQTHADNVAALTKAVDGGK